MFLATATSVRADDDEELSETSDTAEIGVKGDEAKQKSTEQTSSDASRSDSGKLSKFFGVGVGVGASNTQGLAVSPGLTYVGEGVEARANVGIGYETPFSGTAQLAGLRLGGYDLKDLTFRPVVSGKLMAGTNDSNIANGVLTMNALIPFELYGQCGFSVGAGGGGAHASLPSDDKSINTTNAAGPGASVGAWCRTQRLNLQLHTTGLLNSLHPQDPENNETKAALSGTASLYYNLNNNVALGARVDTDASFKNTDSADGHIYAGIDVFGTFGGSSIKKSRGEAEQAD